MPLPLREPFFLKGRTSVAQRAVLMSLALAAGAMVAAWSVAIAVSVTQRIGWHLDVVTLMFAAWPPLITAFVYGPVQVLFQRRWKSILLTVLAWYAAMAAFVGAFVLMMHYRFREPSAALLAFPLTAAIAGLPLIRGYWMYRAVWGISVFGALAAAIVMPAAEASRATAEAWLGAEAAMMVGRAAIFGSWLCAMSVPWGIPFWWPPVREPAEV